MDNYKHNISMTPGIAATPVNVRGEAPRGYGSMRADAVYMNRAAMAVYDSIRPLKSDMWLSNIQLERLAQVGGDEDWDFSFTADILLVRPTRRARIYIPVEVRDGEPKTPNCFRTAAGRLYALNVESVRGLATTHDASWWDSRPQPPRTERAWTDRTLGTPVPARSFFSLASHRIAFQAGQAWTGPDGMTWYDNAGSTRDGKPVRNLVNEETGEQVWVGQEELESGAWALSSPHPAPKATPAPGQLDLFD